MLSQFFILSARGDTIINRDLRKELVKNTPEIFFREVKTYKGDAPPVFNIDGVSYAFLKKASGLYVVGTTRQNASPSFLIDILTNIMKTIKDFCGVVTEEAIRKNFVLIYEVLDEMLDFGLPQYTSTEYIKPMIASEPQLVKSLQGMNSFTPSIFKSNTVASTASMRPVGKKKTMTSNNEIFVDIFERLSILFNASGYIINSSIEGMIQMKSYLYGNPELKIALNDDLVIGRGGNSYGAVILDDCNFNPCVDITQFESNKLMRIKPPEGEFTVMNYRINQEYPAPFRVFPSVIEVSDYKLEFDLRLKAAFPKEIIASYVFVKIPLPKDNSKIHYELPKNVVNQTVDYKEKDSLIEWKIKQFKGQAEHGIKIKISLNTSLKQYNSKKEVGPCSLNFEIPQYNVSKLQLKYLRVDELFKEMKLQRWVRYVTQAASYVCRTH